MDSHLKGIAIKLRKAVKNSIPEAEETVKWGNPTYTIRGKNVVSFCFYKNHVNLVLFEGAKITSHLLEGTGKGMRHIKIRSPSDIKEKEKEMGRVLKEALKLN